MNIYTVSWYNPELRLCQSLVELIIAANSKEEALELALKESWETNDDKIKFEPSMLYVYDLSDYVNKTKVAEVLVNYSY